jgi:hypothetical protein
MIKNINKLLDDAYVSDLEVNFKLICNGNRININNKPFNIKYLDNMMNYYANLEIYENCQIILNFKNKILDHEKNYSPTSNK